MRKYLFLLTAGFVTVAIAFGAVACSDDDDDGNGGDAPTATVSADETPSASGNEVEINLAEYEIGAVPDSASAGEVTFNASNIGTEEHEFVVIKTELAEDQLPTAEDGSVSEDGTGIELIGEIEGIAAGDEQSASFDLEAGNYVLICNIVEEHTAGEVRVHYVEGMRTAFTVTE